MGRRREEWIGEGSSRIAKDKPSTTGQSASQEQPLPAASRHRLKIISDIVDATRCTAIAMPEEKVAEASCGYLTRDLRDPDSHLSRALQGRSGTNLTSVARPLF
jgi:hypothetical protein